MKIDQKKLETLHEHFQEGGSAAEEEVLSVLDTDDVEVGEAYVNALKKAYPEEYGDGEEEVSAEAPQYVFLDPDTNTTKPLHVVKEKPGKVFLSFPEETDVVEITVAGEQIQVDLIKLRKRSPEDTIGGHRVSALIVAAELARA